MSALNPFAPGLRLLWLVGPLLLGYVACSGSADPAPFSIRVAVSPTPPAVGPARVLVLVTDPSGTPLSGLTVTVTAHPAEGSPLGAPMPATELEPGTYVVEAVPFSAGGDWALGVSVTDAQGRAGSLEQRVSVVRGPG